MAAAPDARVPRVTVPSEPLNGRFLILGKRAYSNQYSHVYSRRLDALRPLALISAAERWSAPGASA